MALATKYLLKNFVNEGRNCGGLRMIREVREGHREKNGDRKNESF
jgi:hypothetical protein